MKINYLSERKEFTLESEILLPKPIDEVFLFFSDARNLERLTPPLLQFKILDPDKISMKVGTFINYELKLHGIPFSWTSEITAWNPPLGFSDEQRRGPYRYWIHQHLFEARGNSTLVKDLVRYSVFGGFLVEKLFVRRDLEKIFSFRTEMMKAIFKE